MMPQQLTHNNLHESFTPHDLYHPKTERAGLSSNASPKMQDLLPSSAMVAPPVVVPDCATVPPCHSYS